MHVAPRIVVNCCPLLSIVGHCCPLLAIVVHRVPIAVHCRALLSIVVHCYQYPVLLIVVQCCPLLSTVVHCCPLLSIVVNCCQPPPISDMIYFTIDCHILSLTGLNAFVYTGINTSVFSGAYSCSCSYQNSSDNANVQDCNKNTSSKVQLNTHTSRTGLAGTCGEGRQLDACAVEHLWWQQGYPYRTATAILKPQFKYTHTKSTLKTIPAPKFKKIFH